MWCVFKQIGRRGTSNSESSDVYEPAKDDPRELTRPINKIEPETSNSPGKVEHENDNKSENENGNTEEDSGDVSDSIESEIESKPSSNCVCENCHVLSSLTECGICLDPLQSHRIISCKVCSNVMCRSCSLRMTTCAFCRTTLPPERNRAVERLIGRLILPCRNSRHGCKSLLDGDNRFMHEVTCNFATLGCPVNRGVCNWNGSLAEVEKHMLSEHELHALRDQGVTVEIHNFHEKSFSKDGRQYTVCLNCFDQLFIIKVILFEGKLRVSFCRLGFIRRISIQSPFPRYEVFVNIRTNTNKKLKGNVPFSTFERDIREVAVSCDKLYQPSKETVLNNENVVKIDLIIKQNSYS